MLDTFIGDNLDQDIDWEFSVLGPNDRNPNFVKVRPFCVVSDKKFQICCSGSGSLDYKADDLAQKDLSLAVILLEFGSVWIIINEEQLHYLPYRFKDLAMLDHRLEVDKEDIINVCCTVLNVTTKEISVYWFNPCQFHGLAENAAQSSSTALLITS